MNKQQVFDFFNGKISKTGIKINKEKDEDSAFISGKGTVVWMYNDLVDIWIYNTNGNRINRFMELMEPYDKVQYHIWDGEAMIQTYDVNAVTDNLKFLHIRKKRIATNLNPTFGKGV